MNERTWLRVLLVSLIMFVFLFVRTVLFETFAQAPAPTLNNTPPRDRHPAERIGKDGAPLIRIPEGTFLMGGDAGQEDERPAHHVFLDAFYIDKYEVTVERYAAFMKAQRPERPFKWREATKGAQGRKPVIGVDWYDAKEYCEWAGRRLPSEAEWEKSARGGDQRTYPWGEDPPTKAHTNAGLRTWTGYDSLSAVGSHASGHSPHGVADLSGNVWEWIADRYDQRYYETSPPRNPNGPSTGPLRVLRGGAWNNDAATIRAANRAAYAPSARRNDVGFRCAMNG
jgi:formylglycine-generating enzyme required for sulfatase activity